MGTCSSCGSRYEPMIKISYEGRDYEFDSFECAIHLLAPHCVQCGGKIIGHGLSDDGQFFCCVHCRDKSNA